MAEIFLSYRRQDSQSATGRLADALEAHFGDERVFRDREFVAGEDFVDAIRRSVQSATVLLVVVGRHWLDAADAQRRRRLDDPRDFVRLEIELALAARVAVVPVLVEGATMPSAADLPASLGAFARCQAVELSDSRWRYDVEQLIAALQARYAIDVGSPAARTGEGRATLALTRVASDLFDLALHPTRLIARQQTGRASDSARALAFVAVAIFAGNVLLLFGFDIGNPKGSSLGQAVAANASWLLAGELVGLLFAFLLAAALALAWRLVGGGPAFRRAGIVFAFIYGGVWLGLCTGAVVSGSAVQLVDSTFFARLLAATQASATAPDAAVAAMPELRWRDAPYGGVAAVLLLLAAGLWAATFVWCIAAWGAFRNAFATTRARSWLATSLWLALLALVAWLGKFLA